MGTIASVLALLLLISTDDHLARAQSTGEETVVLPASRDTWTAQNPGWRSNVETTVDHGSSPSLVVGYHGPERGHSTGYIDVDLSGVARGRHLQSAHLELFALRSDGGPATAPIPPLEIRPVTGRWGESAPRDWEQPVGTRSASGTPWVHPARDAWARFDVTTEVRERLAGRDGQGWRLKSAWPVQIWTTRFGSLESEWPPRLVLVFAEPDPAGRLFLPRLDTRPSRREVDETTWPWSEPLEPSPAPDDPLALELSLDRAELMPWESGKDLVLRASLRNQGADPLTVVAPLEYSSLRFRMPLYQWELRREGQPLREFSFPGCGTFAELAFSDFVTLAPGESLELLAGSSLDSFFPDYLLREPGAYTLRLHYVLDREGGIPERGFEAYWDRSFETWVSSEAVPLTLRMPSDRFGRRYAQLRLVQPTWSTLEIEALAGPADQVEHRTKESSTWVYYLRPPEPGEPEQLRCPSCSDPRPRMLFYLDRHDRVSRIVQLP